MTASIRNVFTNPLTAKEKIREGDILALRMALLKQEIAAALHKPVSAVDDDDMFDFSAADLAPNAKCTVWLRNYRPQRPAPEPEWPQPSIDLITLEGDE